MSSDKRTMTYIGKIELIEFAYRKMLVGEKLSFEENSLLLATAICLLKEYDADQTKKLFLKFHMKSSQDILLHQKIINPCMIFPSIMVFFLL